jgi:hypothetical protein
MRRTAHEKRFIFSFFTCLMETCGLKVEAFENVKDQIGHCGIWCGSCAVGNGSLRELTKQYLEIIEKHGLEHWAPKNFDFKEFRKGLVSVSDASFCSGCLKGGGRTNCEIRSCASNKKITNCSICDEFMTCENSKPLKMMREGAKESKLLVINKNGDERVFLEKRAREKIS